MAESTGKKALKSAVWYTVANFATRAMSFITMPLFSRLMTKADIGNISNFMSWIGILGSILTFNLSSSVTIAKFEFKDKLNEYISSVLLLGSLITSFFFLLSLPVRNHVMERMSINRLEYYLLFLLSFLSPSLEMLQIKNRLEYRYKLSVVLSLGLTLVTAAASILCVVTFEDKLTGRLLGTYVPAIILYAAIYCMFFVRTPSLKTGYWKYALVISVPLIIHDLSGRLLSASDRLMITRICGADYNALYSVGYSCCMVIQLLWFSLNTAWSPWAFEQMDRENFGALRKASKPYLIFFGFIVLAFLLVAPDFLFLMGGEAYRPALGVIPPVVTGFVFQFVYSLYVNIETFCKKQKYIAFGTSFAAGLNIVLNLIFIPRLGFEAAAYTTLAGYMALFLIHFSLVRNLDKEWWYDTRFNFAFLAFFFVIVLSVPVLYRNDMIRYIMIVFFAVIGCGFAIWLREELIDMIKKRSINKLREKIRPYLSGGDEK